MTKSAILTSIVVVVLLGVDGFQLWRMHALTQRLEDAEWKLAIESKSHEDTLRPDVGRIQFLRRGYSITLKAVRYTSEGLYMEGEVGNPMNLVIHNLTLRFSATKSLDQYREEFRGNRELLSSGPPTVGQGETSPIASLGPGSLEHFEVTIPNVKQTQDGVRIAVQFSGARYGYGAGF
jgi:hypothetical protein